MVFTVVAAAAVEDMGTFCPAHLRVVPWVVKGLLEGTSQAEVAVLILAEPLSFDIQPMPLNVH